MPGSLNSVMARVLLSSSLRLVRTSPGMGKYGAMLVSRTDTFFAPALMVEARSTVGAGDAMIGGVLAGLSRGESLAESFRWGVAAGAASVMTDGTQLLRRPDFEALLPKVTVQEV